MARVRRTAGRWSDAGYHERLTDCQGPVRLNLNMHNTTSDDN